jgi:hypothetical protein
MIPRVKKYLEGKGWYVLPINDRQQGALHQQLVAIQPAMGYVHFRTGLAGQEPRVDLNRMVPRVLLVQCRSTPITSQDEAAAPLLGIKARALGCEAVLATMSADEQIKLRWVEPEEKESISIP